MVNRRLLKPSHPCNVLLKLSSLMLISSKQYIIILVYSIFHNNIMKILSNMCIVNVINLPASILGRCNTNVISIGI